jgi:hypothetical protein
MTVIPIYAQKIQVICENKQKKNIIGHRSHTKERLRMGGIGKGKES